MVKRFGEIYIPDIGDIVWLDFDPQVGREQAKRRPAICLSPKDYNEKSELAIFCPITSVSKGYPFEVEINIEKIKGVILADQVRSLDYKERKAQFIQQAPEDILEKVKDYICLLIDY
ncbi:endoribonuclease MazF [Venenivibrio stagnispumantis]|uniref:mRNA interferase MazF n=1 Tax=Venenivibrio stagnispumantis TaxID=407998 RepID=A0AA46AFL2_9AQUI|nr:endoribonuclease MazF [Venenivibrio stagnispumantis]MCW4573791.1 endoribonuclease MazF [Venenivibrio stagnispumantis]SMP20312.1 mRNA interferase MazF [Venenivibrio stagnispumantis]